MEQTVSPRQPSLQDSDSDADDIKAHLEAVIRNPSPMGIVSSESESEELPEDSQRLVATGNNSKEKKFCSDESDDECAKEFARLCSVPKKSFKRCQESSESDTESDTTTSRMKGKSSQERKRRKVENTPKKKSKQDGSKNSESLTQDDEFVPISSETPKPKTKKLKKSKKCVKNSHDQSDEVRRMSRDLAALRKSKPKQKSVPPIDFQTLAKAAVGGEKKSFDQSSAPTEMSLTQNLAEFDETFNADNRDVESGDDNLSMVTIDINNFDMDEILGEIPLSAHEDVKTYVRLQEAFVKNTQLLKKV